MENSEKMSNDALYRKLQSSLNADDSYEKENLGEGMFLLQVLWGSYWKPRYLVDDEVRMAYEFLDTDCCLATFTVDDIAWETLENLSEELKQRARKLNAHFPTIVSGYHDGVAEVSWQINPDGMYYMDSDGFGMSDDEEETLYGFIDRKGKPLVKFRRIKDFSELKDMEREAKAHAIR